MTFLEKFRKERPKERFPERTTKLYCPHELGYEKEQPKKCKDSMCDECWDREIPGTVPTEIVKLQEEAAAKCASFRDVLIRAGFTKDEAFTMLLKYIESR